MRLKIPFTAKTNDYFNQSYIKSDFLKVCCIYFLQFNSVILITSATANLPKTKYSAETTRSFKCPPFMNLINMKCWVAATEKAEVSQNRLINSESSLRPSRICWK